MAYSGTISIPMAYKDWLKDLQRRATSLQRRAVKKRPAETGMDKKPAKTGRGVSRLSKTGETVRPLKTAAVRLVRDVRTPWTKANRDGQRVSAAYKADTRGHDQQRRTRGEAKPNPVTHWQTGWAEGRGGRRSTRPDPHPIIVRYLFLRVYIGVLFYWLPSIHTNLHGDYSVPYRLSNPYRLYLYRQFPFFYPSTFFHFSPSTTRCSVLVNCNKNLIYFF